MSTPDRTLPSGPLLEPAPQPPGVPWPTGGWPVDEATPSGAFASLVERAFDTAAPVGVTQALVVIHGGRLVYQRYAGSLEFFDRPEEPVTPNTRFLSWSMAKSVLHAVVGILIERGLLHPADPASAPEWAGPRDPRWAITLEHLLEMRDGLAFSEDYEDFETSDALQMLFGKGRHDVAAFAADRPLAAAPGTRFSYSSGTSNVLSGAVARAVGPGEPYRRLLDESLFGPLGMASAEPGFDDVGTWVASSELHATAEDFARFGLLYLRDGIWEGRPILPEGWVDHGRLARSVDPDDGELHGAHWWVVDDGFGTYRASGYEGQIILVVPAIDTVVVRLGKTPESKKPALAEWRRQLVPALARWLGHPGREA